MVTDVTMSKEGMDGENDVFDVIVIGGGPAGYVAAIKAAQLGGKAALIEKDTLGGTCLNRGCIPTKTYLKNAEIMEQIQQAVKRGIMIENPTVQIDMYKAAAYKNSVVTALTSGIEGLLETYGISMYKGVGKLLENREVLVDNRVLLKGKKIILATGSKPMELSRLKKEGIELLDSDKILDLKEVPKRLAIIGGGVIGVEMAMIYRAYGSKVTMIEMADAILPKMDKDISSTLLKVFKKKGIKVIASAQVEDIEKNEEGLILRLGEKGEVQADEVLVSVGRMADLDAVSHIPLELEAGRVWVNEYMETSVSGIYAPGDVNGRNMLAHAAFKMGEVAAENAMGHRVALNLNMVPSCVYTTPEIAAVGLTEEEARKKYDILIGKFFFGANGRALASGEKVGFVKVIADKAYGEILGVHILGPGATEIINEAAALMDMQITVYEASQIIHGHPTYSEAFMEACADCIGKSIHLPPKI